MSEVDTTASNRQDPTALFEEVVRRIEEEARAATGPPLPPPPIPEQPPEQPIRPPAPAPEEQSDAQQVSQGEGTHAARLNMLLPEVESRPAPQAAQAQAGEAATVRVASGWYMTGRLRAIREWLKFPLSCCVLLYIYSVFGASCYFSWQFAHEHGFGSYILYGDFVSVGKGAVWPYFALRDAFGEKPLSEDQRQEAEDAATSFWLLARSAVSFEPEATARANKARVELRSRLAGFNAAQLTEVDRQVRAIFRAEAILSRDFGSFLLDGEPLTHRFSESSELRGAISTRPPKVRVAMDMQLGNMDDDLRATFKAAGDSRGAMIRNLAKSRDYVWAGYKREYEDLFKCLMPSREELTRQPDSPGR